MRSSSTFAATTSFASQWVLLGCATLTVAACAGDRTERDRWDGTVDTLPSGTIVVHNPSHGIWDSSTAWRVEEEVRIGTLEGSGPDLFGRISALEVDGLGRLYVFESQTQELRVFESSGAHVRTIGGEGSAPGEFKQGIGLAWSPKGHLWVVDPGNVRVSVFDTSGTYLTMNRIMGGYVMVPWRGRFDRAGRFYHYGLDVAADAESRLVMVRFDSLMNPIDTIPIPRPTEDRNFDIQSEDGMTRTGARFGAGDCWTLSASGQLWFGNTGDYRVYRRSASGDTTMAISREFEPLPDLPALSTLYMDEDDRLWVVPVVAGEDSARLLDVFESSGRYMGRILLPFRLSADPVPLFRSGYIYGVTFDEFDVPYVVKGRILMP